MSIVNVSIILSVINSVLSDKLKEEEFIQGVMDNQNILRLVQFDQPQKVQARLKEMKH